MEKKNLRVLWFGWTEPLISIPYWLHIKISHCFDHGIKQRPVCDSTWLEHAAGCFVCVGVCVCVSPQTLWSGRDVFVRVKARPEIHRSAPVFTTGAAIGWKRRITWKHNTEGGWTVRVCVCMCVCACVCVCTADPPLCAKQRGWGWVVREARGWMSARPFLQFYKLPTCRALLDNHWCVCVCVCVSVGTGTGMASEGSANPPGAQWLLSVQAHCTRPQSYSMQDTRIPSKKQWVCVCVCVCEHEGGAWT